ncbi:MAG: hypothetical protein IPG47_16160 [Thermoflexaceae bacterium]|nr:hypothetical protein [Thermoflexaceae bacterium]
MSTTFQPQGALATVSGDRPRPALRAPRGAMPNSIDAAGLRQILSVVPRRSCSFRARAKCCL